MEWLYLIIAGLFEISFTVFLKISDNFTNIKWSILFIISYILSVVFLSKSMQQIPMGTAYAVWTGIGAVGAVLIGIIFFKESTDFWRLFFIFTLVASIVGLKLVS